VDLGERKDATARRHPWELARADFFLGILAEHGLLDSGGDWLDVGAGDAWFAGRLRRRVQKPTTVTCWDINYLPLDLASAEAGLTLVEARPAQRFDRILMLDVIEHVEDDEGFVRATVDDLLAEDGYVLVSVPSYQSLYSAHDRALRHLRRYSPRGCRALLERSGLVVLSAGGLFSSLLSVRLMQVMIWRVRPGPGTSAHGVGGWQHGEFVTRSLTRALAADGKLSQAATRRGRAVPGLSYWALCRRRG
jgi:SAM-dependent methyltransferase